MKYFYFIKFIYFKPAFFKIIEQYYKQIIYEKNLK